MTYRAGTRGLAHLGVPDGDPRIICDGCGTALSALTKSRGPQKWLIEGKAPKGWRCIQHECTRTDYCPRCREKGGANG